MVARIGPRRFTSECRLLRLVGRLLRRVPGRQFNFECTVITEDDESRGVWDRFIEDKKAGSTGSLMPPAPMIRRTLRGQAHTMPLRLYGKFFDKLTKDLDPTRGQCPMTSRTLFRFPLRAGVWTANTPASNGPLRNSLRITRRCMHGRSGRFYRYFPACLGRLYCEQPDRQGQDERRLVLRSLNRSYCRTATAWGSDAVRWDGIR